MTHKDFFLLLSFFGGCQIVISYVKDHFYGGATISVSSPSSNYLETTGRAIALLRWEHSQDFSRILFFGVYLAFLVNSTKYFLGLDKSFCQTESSLIVVIVRLEGFPGFIASNLQSYQDKDIKSKHFFFEIYSSYLPPVDWLALPGPI